jgi:hypothetical protein
MLVTRGGDGELRCCAQPMQLRGASPPAAADKAAETSTSGGAGG